ncbi:nuclear transport factor 2 family protein [Streptomyces sp. ADMS]|uniref:nuclear transport factor 2 family protein n=1 Tax=Streptomyces sp. ADMS TaxID=3071415 RepID=UPI00296EBF8C|nr:nuclear transport factor 2 family protein [Streptomyces sp. ADMS]MDW4907999.1 nuclear transport factor 2 family protein [Streptomyces sp. ADMS]
MTDTARTTEAAGAANVTDTADLRRTVERFWATAEAGDWDACADTLSDDVVYTLPQTRERIRGKERFVRFNREYPSGWELRTVRVVAEPGQVVTWLRFTVGAEEMHAISFFTGDEKGNIATMTDFWPEPYEPPASRDHLTALTERY